MKKLSLILLFSLGALSAFAQQRITLDLQQTIALANDSSLEAFRTKNMYLAGYWEYRTYKANRLPSLTLNMTPAQYNRDITKRYDSEQDLDIYRSQQSFYAYGNLAVRQNFDLTGGTFYLDTELGYMRSFGGNKYTQFTSVPVRLGYSQSLVGYNPFRWERRIEPLKYEKVKKEYITMQSEYPSRPLPISLRLPWHRRNMTWPRTMPSPPIPSTASACSA